MNLPVQTGGAEPRSEISLPEKQEPVQNFFVRLSPNKDSLPATILLVDDEPDLLYVTELILAMNGYQVIACSEADMAVLAFHEAASINLLLTDMQLPGRSGIELARELTAIRSSLPILIMSGGNPTPKARSEMQERNWKFLSKTDDEAILLITIATLLRESSIASV